MFDMFDSNKRGWLIKLIEAVEEDAIDVIVEDEDGIAVEGICSMGAICGSDTMKKQVRVAQTSVFNTELYEWTMREEKEAKKRE